MSYAILSLGFLSAAAVAGVMLPLLAGTRRPSTAGLAASAAALLLLTAIFDNAMIAAELFHYAPSQLLGLHIGVAPIEDFAYPLAAVLLLPSIWVVLIKRKRRHRASEGRTGSGE